MQVFVDVKVTDILAVSNMLFVCVSKGKIKRCLSIDPKTKLYYLLKTNITVWPEKI